MQLSEKYSGLKSNPETLAYIDFKHYKQFLTDTIYSLIGKILTVASAALNMNYGTLLSVERNQCDSLYLKRVFFLLFNVNS